MEMLDQLSVWGTVIVEALGWTVIHSLWQGALIYFVFITLLFFGKNLKAQTKYWLGLSSMFSFVAWVAITFVGQIQVMLPAPLQALSQNFYDTNYQLLFVEMSPIQEALDPLSMFAPWLGALWIVGMIWSGRQTFKSYLDVRKLKKSALDASPELLSMVTKLTRKVGMKIGFRLLESKDVIEPMVISFLKPTLLVPVQFMVGLTNGQAEAVLLHELAHIQRYDHLILFIQLMVESLFFYHPFVLAISREISVEREKCCDDFVIRYSDDRMAYAKAIGLLAQRQLPTYQWRLGISGNQPGRKKNLLNRIKRIMKPEPQFRGWKDRVFPLLLLTMLFVSLSFYGFTMAEKWDVLKIESPAYLGETEGPSALTDFLAEDQFLSQLLGDTSREEAVEITEPLEKDARIEMNDLHNAIGRLHSLDENHEVDLLSIREKLSDIQHAYILSNPISNIAALPSQIASGDYWTEVTNGSQHLAMAELPAFPEFGFDNLLIGDSTDQKALEQAKAKYDEARRVYLEKLEETRHQRQLLLKQSREEMQAIRELYQEQVESQMEEAQQNWELSREKRQGMLKEAWNNWEEDSEGRETAMKEAMKSLKEHQKAFKSDFELFQRDHLDCDEEIDTEELIEAGFGHNNVFDLDPEYASLFDDDHSQFGFDDLQERLNSKNEAFEKLLKEWRKEGIISSRKARVIVKEGFVKVNGKKLSKEQEKRFREIMSVNKFVIKGTMLF